VNELGPLCSSGVALRQAVRRQFGDPAAAAGGLVPVRRTEHAVRDDTSSPGVMIIDRRILGRVGQEIRDPERFHSA
jgi:hypothetical protein